MYTPYREDNGINLNIPWETNTAKGFAYSMMLSLILFFLGSHIEIEKATLRNVEISRIPIEIIRFGVGDGTGQSKGNLTAEGMKHKGIATSTNLSDAETASKTHISSNVTIPNPEDASRFNPTKDVGSTVKNDGNETASGTRNIGVPTGSLDGRGLGDKGYGQGAGLGLGDIEWGGGGNRSVAYKKVPNFPSGSRGGQVRIRFVVDSKGSVVSMRPALKGGDPILESSAMNALRMWKFNPLKEEKDMEGIISFTFKLR